MNKKDTLICTVGTSLLDSNIARLGSPSPDKPGNWETMLQHYNNSRWADLAKELAKLEPSARTCGAEINSIYEIVNRKKNPIAKIFFIVSDTKQGEETGALLKNYFELPNNPIGTMEVETLVADGLQDAEPKQFKSQGLRNLVKRIGEVIQRIGQSDTALIDATGGYKAQIAVAVIMGQVLGIPVLYKHERFSEIIDFPPLPVSFDYTLIGRYSPILNPLERGELLCRTDCINFFDSEQEAQDALEKLRVFLTEETVNDEICYELTPIGQVYLTGFRNYVTRFVRLEPAQDRKEPTFGNDHHYPEGFKDFVNKLFQENTWIRFITTLPYNRQKSIKPGIHFAIKTEGKESMLLGTYTDRNSFGARFKIELASTGPEALSYAAQKLTDTYA